MLSTTGWLVSYPTTPHPTAARYTPHTSHLINQRGVRGQSHTHGGRHAAHNLSRKWGGQRMMCLDISKISTLERAWVAGHLSGQTPRSGTPTRSKDAHCCSYRLCGCFNIENSRAIEARACGSEEDQECWRQGACKQEDVRARDSRFVATRSRPHTQPHAPVTAR
jgi:hypothetical protein